MDNETTLKLLLSYYIDNYGYPDDDELSEYYEKIKDDLNKESTLKTVKENMKIEEYLEKTLIRDSMDLTYISLCDLREFLLKKINEFQIFVRNIETLIYTIEKINKNKE